MRRVLLLSAALAVVALATSGEAPAADVNAVLKACDNTPGCGYSIDQKTGDISGCSTKSGTCFYCPNDGKRQCFQVRQQVAKGGPPIRVPGADNLLTNLGASPGPAKPKLGAGAVVPAAPAASQ
ncbi:MAG: hypothetical protein ACOY4L_04730 [Pseudomonadota bacterium]